MRALHLITALVALFSAGCPGLVHSGMGSEMPLAHMKLSPPSFTSLRATATIEQIDHGKRVRGRVYVLMRKPASIRFDVMSPADTPLAILTADESSFALLDSTQDAFFKGPPSACNVARLLSIPLPPEAVADMLSGAPPLIEAQERRLTWKLKGYHLLTLRSGELKQQVQVVTGKLGMSALRSVVWRGKSIVYDLRFLHRVPVGKTGQALPRKIRFSMPHSSRAVELTYRSIEIDPQIPQEAFHQDPPQGLPVRHVDCEPQDG
jgi:outer membrane lipoprotein-sorting protein